MFKLKGIGRSFLIFFTFLEGGFYVASDVVSQEAFVELTMMGIRI